MVDQVNDDEYVLYAAIDDEFRALALPIDNFNVFGDQQPPPGNGDADDVRQIRLPPIIKETDLCDMVRSLNSKL